MMIEVREGPQEGRCGMKRRNKEKSTAQEENHNKIPQTSPVFIPKKDGKKWMVQDYHYLNEYMVKNNYLLPLIAQLVDKLQEAKLFTKMDLRWGYNNVHIKGNDEWKAAFTCFCGSFEPSSCTLGYATHLLHFK